MDFLRCTFFPAGVKDGHPRGDATGPRRPRHVSFLSRKRVRGVARGGTGIAFILIVGVDFRREARENHGSSRILGCWPNVELPQVPAVRRPRLHRLLWHRRGLSALPSLWTSVVGLADSRWPLIAVRPRGRPLVLACVVVEHRGLELLGSCHAIHLPRTFDHVILVRLASAAATPRASS